MQLLVRGACSASPRVLKALSSVSTSFSNHRLVRGRRVRPHRCPAGAGFGPLAAADKQCSVLPEKKNAAQQLEPVLPSARHPAPNKDRSRRS